MSDQPKRVLVLYRLHYPLNKLRLSSLQQLQALDKSDKSYEIIYFNAVFGVPSWFKNLDFDVIILSTLFLGMRWFPRYFRTWKQTMTWIADVNCLKIAIPQDEYDHAHILDDWLDEWHVQVIFTNFNETYRSILYPKMSKKAEFHECFTGYLDKNTIANTTIKPIAERPLDIIYRARHLPYWFGKYGQFKHLIAEKIIEYAPKHNLKIDVSTQQNDTIIGENWTQFMASARATIGCESGVSALDPHGAVKREILQLLADDPQLSFQEVKAQIPADWDEYEFLAIGPRHLEATQTKTCQILIRGRYSGVLVADKHYIPVEHDFSNLDAVLDLLKNDDYIQTLVDNAYHDIACNPAYTYTAFAAQLDTVIDKHTLNKPYHSKTGLKQLVKLVSAMIAIVVAVADFGIRTFKVRKVINKLLASS